MKTFLSHRQEKKGTKKVVSCQLRLWLCRLVGSRSPESPLVTLTAHGTWSIFLQVTDQPEGCVYILDLEYASCQCKNFMCVDSRDRGREKVEEEIEEEDKKHICSQPRSVSQAVPSCLSVCLSGLSSLETLWLSAPESRCLSVIPLALTCW